MPNLGKEGKLRKKATTVIVAVTRTRAVIVTRRKRVTVLVTATVQ